jgi:hypothetical protein
MKMFSDGDVAVPALEFKTISRYSFRKVFNVIQVTAIDGNKVTTADGTVLRTNQILLATTANTLLAIFAKAKNDFASGYKHLF